MNYLMGTVESGRPKVDKIWSTATLIKRIESICKPQELTVCGVEVEHYRIHSIEYILMLLKYY
jgi:hypothetical protein